MPEFYTRLCSTVLASPAYTTHTPTHFFSLMATTTKKGDTGDHHRTAAAHHTAAAKHHTEAAKHTDAGNHEKAAHHAQTASGHAASAKSSSRRAAKNHAADHSDK